MRRGLIRFKLLLPWFLGVMASCIFLVLPIMFGLAFLSYGPSAPHVYDRAIISAIVVFICALLLAVVPVFQVNAYLDARDRISYMRENVIAGKWMMWNANLIGWGILFWYKVLVPFGAMVDLVIRNLDPPDIET